MRAVPFLIFVEEPPAPKRQTRRWTVMTRIGDGVTLGIVQWLPQWRQYVFQPAYPTAFEQDCLRDIAKFIEDRTREHKEAAAASRRAKGA